MHRLVRIGPASVLAGILPAAVALAAPPPGGELIVRDPSLRAAAPESAAAAAEFVRVDTSVLAADPEALWLEPAPGEGRWAYRNGIERDAAGGLSWRGRFAEDGPDYTSVTLTLHGGLVLGTLEVPRGPTYLLRSRSEGIGELRVEDPRALECGVGAGEHAADGEAAHGDGSTAPSPLPSPALDRVAGAAEEREVYILVLYTPRAAVKVGGARVIESAARHNVDVLNTAFANSGVDGRAFLAAVERADLGFSDMSGSEALVHAIEHPLSRQLQDRWRADLVSVVVDSSDEAPSVCGYANVMFRRMVGPQMADRAYNVVGEGCFTGGRVFTHEVGHNFGAQHDPVSAAPPPSAAYPFSFAHGVEGAFRTLMAYPTACNDCGILHTVFSNPLRSIDGIPTGVADRRDNARTLNLTFPVVAAFRGGRPDRPSPRPPPAAPSGLAAVAVSPTEVALTWTDNADDETGHEVEVRAGGGEGADWQRVAEPPRNATAHTAGGLLPDTDYRFRVRAVRRGRASEYSEEAAARTPPAVPATPTGLAAEPLSATAIALRWDAAARAAGYQVEVSTADPAADRGAAPIVLGPGGAVVGDLEAATPYTFRVRALNPQGVSGWSAPASATTAGPGGPCAAGGSTLCLLGGRFELRARWRNPRPPFRHGTAAAQPAPGSQRTGVFSFFNPDNVELAVKMLDGRAATGSFWLFYGALTDVEYWLSVRDTAGGGSRTYYNPPFELCGRGDTRAFLEGPEGPAAGPAAAPRPIAAAPAPVGAGTCTPGPDALCLAAGRFRVEVEWDDPRVPGERGDGHVFAGLGSDLTGHFWFFRPDNLELSVKILDARAIDGHHWIFWGGLSDVGYTIRVTDTESGEVHRFENEPLNLCGGAVTGVL